MGNPSAPSQAQIAMLVSPEAELTGEEAYARYSATAGKCITESGGDNVFPDVANLYGDVIKSGVSEASRHRKAREYDKRKR